LPDRTTIVWVGLKNSGGVGVNGLSGKKEGKPENDLLLLLYFEELLVDRPDSPPGSSPVLPFRDPGTAHVSKLTEGLICLSS